MSLRWRWSAWSLVGVARVRAARRLCRPPRAADAGNLRPATSRPSAPSPSCRMHTYRCASVSYLSGPTLAIVVACITALTMIVARVATLVSSQSVSVAAKRTARASMRCCSSARKSCSSRTSGSTWRLPACRMACAWWMPSSELVVCNKRYADIYGLPAELTKPGTPLSACWTIASPTASTSGGDAQAYREERLRAGDQDLGQDLPAERRAHGAGHAPADARRRLDRHSRGHHRAAGACRKPSARPRKSSAAVFDAVPRPSSACAGPARHALEPRRGADLRLHRGRGGRPAL